MKRKKSVLPGKQNNKCSLSSKLWLLFMFFCLVHPKAFANNPENQLQIKAQQDKNTITGVVVDEDGVEIPGVTVVVKGTSEGTITNTNGKYSISIDSDEAVLTFSFVGYLSEEITVGTNTTIDVVMIKDLIGLEEVVVIGYGSQKSEDLTYSVSQLKSEDLLNRPVFRLESAMQGQLAGVTVRQSNGGPGSAPEFVIRGTNSINAGSGPLYVIDGMPTTNSNIVGNLNFNSVESVEVLKDAAAAAIYGSRGAGGVVIITTKKGERGKTKLFYNGYYGIQEPEKTIDMLSGPEQRAMIKEAYEDVNGAGTFIDWDLPADEDYNHLDEYFRTGHIQGHELALSGGSKNSSYYGSLNYLNNEGIVLGTAYERYSARMNATFNINKYIEVGTSLETSYSDKQDSEAHGKGKALDHIIVNAAFMPTDLYRKHTYDEERAAPYENPLYSPSNGASRSLDRAEFIDDHDKRGQILTNTYLKIELAKGLTAKTMFGFVHISSDRRKFCPSNRFEKTRVERYTRSSNNWLSETTIDYSKSYGGHSISLLAGFTAQKDKREDSGIKGTEFPNDVVPTLNAATSYSSINNNINEWGLISYLGRAMYSFGDRYFLTTSIRRDGSSKFGKDSRWGIFPSASVGWKISSEDFFNVSFVDLLKLRFSWGQTGNNQIGNYDQYGVLDPVTAVFGRSTIEGGYAIRDSQLENRDLEWEKNNSINIGFDTKLWKGRAQLSIDYYNNTTSDLLLNVPLPTISGYSQGRQNIGEVVNKGFDFEITTVNISKSNFTWSTTFVLNINDNEVTKMNEPDAEILDGPWFAKCNITRVGDPIGALYMWEADGIYNTEEELIAHDVEYDDGIPRVGELKIVDQNGDGLINEEDRVVVGQPMAKYTFGFTNTIIYKNFDFSMLIAGAGGNKIYNAAGREAGNFNAMGRKQNKYAYFKDRWTPENTDAEYPRVSGGQFPYSDGNAKETTLDLFDGDYWRIKNLTIGYEFNSELIKNRIERARLFVSIENLFLFDNYEVGMNPETNGAEGGSSAIDGAGMDYATYPNPRTYTFGINLTF